MGCYDIFETKEGDNAQIKAFQESTFRVFRVGSKIPEANGKTMNIASPEGYILEIRDGIYVGFKEIDPRIFISSQHGFYGYNYNSEKIVPYLTERYGADYAKIPIISKYGQAIQ